MKKFLFLVGVLLTIFLVYFCISKHAPQIENDVGTRIVAALDGEDLPNDFGLNVSGRDVMLTGTTEHENLKVRVEDIARSIAGVRVVDNQIQILKSAVPPPPPLNLSPLLLNTVERVRAPVAIVDGGGVEAETETEVVEAPVVDECQTDLAALLEIEKINFDSGQNVIRPDSFDLLSKLAEAAKNCSNSVIHIHGHTDSSGDYEKNRLLSLARAKSVGRYLIEKGVSQEVRAFGHGSSKPLVSNETPEGRAQNRRIEFKVNKKEN